jgi:hypothetical protein
MSTHKALVAGAHGVIGRSVAEYLSARPGWNVIGAARRTAEDQETLQHLSVDLLDPEDCTAKLSELHDITHLIFAAYAERTTPADLVRVNVALLQNLLDAMEPSSPQLRHVTLYQGGKAYGCHLGNCEHLEVQKNRQAGRMIFLRRAPFIALSFLPHKPRDYLLRCSVSLHRTRALKGPLWISIWSTFQKLPPRRGRKENYAETAKHDRRFHA